MNDFDCSLYPWAVRNPEIQFFEELEIQLRPQGIHDLTIPLPYLFYLSISLRTAFKKKVLHAPTRISLHDWLSKAFKCQKCFFTSFFSSTNVGMGMRSENLWLVRLITFSFYSYFGPFCRGKYSRKEED